MRISKIVLKNGNSQFRYVKNRKKWEFPCFCTKNDWIFWEFPCLLYPCNQKSAQFFLDFPVKNVVNFFGIPMSSLVGVHLISGIAQWAQQLYAEVTEDGEDHWIWLRKEDCCNSLYGKEWWPGQCDV